MNPNLDTFLIDENTEMRMAAISVLGDREEQQDCFGYKLSDDSSLFVICDGMGGHQGGQLASKMAVQYVLKKYQSNTDIHNQVEFLVNALVDANKMICNLKGDDGLLLHAGSTFVGIIIKDKKMIWASVGDSRAYLIRGNEYVQLTQDQNYFTVLKEQLNAGVITKEEYIKEGSKGEALISFLGIGDLRLIDYSTQPFNLESNDKIIIMSDGLYKVLSDEEMFRVCDNFSNASEAIQTLELKARKKAKSNNLLRDNTTIAFVKMK